MTATPQFNSRLGSTQRLVRLQVRLQQTFRQRNSRPPRTRRKRKVAGSAERREELWEERPSEPLPEMLAGEQPSAQPLVLCVAEECSALRTNSPKNRRLRRQVHSCNSKPIRPKPHTTNKWRPSSEGSRLAWMHAGIRSNRFNRRAPSARRAASVRSFKWHARAQLSGMMPREVVCKEEFSPIDGIIPLL